jgi:hypothetical protein
MNKVYALKSKQSELRNETAYLMPGNELQLTSSFMQARKFFSFDDAQVTAQKIGGMEVVELEFTREQIVQKRDECLLQANKEFWQELLNQTKISVIEFYTCSKTNGHTSARIFVTIDGDQLVNVGSCNNHSFRVLYRVEVSGAKLKELGGISKKGY